MNNLLSHVRYKSRPDLSPPKLHIGIATDPGSLAPGYIFVTPCALFDAPRDSGPEQPGAYIFRSDGDLVWSSLGFLGGWTANFQAVTYRGQPVLQAFTGQLAKRHGRGYGTHVLLDGGYKQVATVQSLDRLVSFHEFRVVGGKTALVQVRVPRVRDLGGCGGGGGEGKRWVVDDVFQEIDIETGETVFEGRSLDFADPKESFVALDSQPNCGESPDTAWDYFHTNSVDKTSDGDYLVSGRFMCAIYKISSRDGSLVWRLGGQGSSFTLQNDLKFAYQHDVRHLGLSDGGQTETISMMDNHVRSDEQHPPGEAEGHHSRGLVVQINHKTKTATALQTFAPPAGLLAGGQGNVQMLPNGNAFVGWGVRGAFTEFLGNGTPIYHVILGAEEGVQSYRAFRYEWEGRPREKPAVVAARDDKGGVTAWVSWNGDTVTKKWSFFGRGSAGDVHFGDATRKSFETSLQVDVSKVKDAGNIKVFAVALDAEDHELGRSGLADVWTK
ncbi:ASST-domain-containing protein [Podospora aff. communis PSN243]|uniref:ASST-domain-containing protein n=1 Tax=Podospora aff. communis PSN243 TaxID=3040156 RepID=A0AAV9GFZ1_9PEZI|nr:ASST-domain-containing protein [Podospora aff. communis PSN243]